MKPKDKAPKSKVAKKRKRAAKTAKSSVSKRSQSQGTTKGIRENAGLLNTSGTKSSVIQAKRKATIEDWFESVRAHMARTAGSGAPTGACLVPDANGGPSLCIEMTQESCNSPAVKGQWQGGDC